VPAPLKKGRGWLVAAVLFLVALVAGAGSWLALGRPPAAAPAGKGTQAAHRKQKFIHRPSQLAPLDPARIVRDPRLHAPVIKDQVLATLHRDVSERDFQQVLDGFDIPVRIIGRIPSLHMVQLETSADRLLEVRQRLANHPYVAAAGLNFVYSPAAKTVNDPFLDPQKFAEEYRWGILRIRAPEAWEITTGTVTIGIVDSGCKFDHEELANKITYQFSFATSNGEMFDSPFINAQGVQQFVMGHGTHVAITAAGIADNGKGTAGIAPTCPLVAVQVFTLNEQKNALQVATAGSLAEGISKAIDGGARVINYSIGQDYEVSDRDWLQKYQQATPEQQAEMEKDKMAAVEVEMQSFSSALARAQASGVIIVKAAGNNGISARLDGLNYSQRVITVAATDQNNGRGIFRSPSQDNPVASASNYGDYTMVSAPGTQIWSGYSDPNQPYARMDGTSMAAPHVTGVVALMKSVKPDLTFEEARDILRATGRVLPTDRPIGPLVDARAALEEVQRRMQNGTASPQALPPLTQDPPGPAPQPSTNGTQILADAAPWKRVEVQWLIDTWLSSARPPLADGGSPWFFNQWGQAVNGNTVFTTKRPNPGGRSRHEWLWRQAPTLRSARHGTLGDFVRTRLGRGRFDPTPPPLYPPSQRPQQNGPDRTNRDPNGPDKEKRKGSAGQLVTLEGELTCAKCGLGMTVACTNAIKVKEGGRVVIYLLDDARGRAPYHAQICTGSKPGSVTGTVTRKGGQLYIKPAKDGVKFRPLQPRTSAGKKQVVWVLKQGYPKLRPEPNKLLKTVHEDKTRYGIKRESLEDIIKAADQLSAHFQFIDTIPPRRQMDSWFHFRIRFQGGRAPVVLQPGQKYVVTLQGTSSITRKPANVDIGAGETSLLRAEAKGLDVRQVKLWIGQSQRLPEVRPTGKAVCPFWLVDNPPPVIVLDFKLPLRPLLHPYSAPLVRYEYERKELTGEELKALLQQ
jgi:subtilisin family serine protease